MKFYEQQRRTNFNVGIFVIVSIAILVFGYLWLTNYLEQGKMTNLTIAFPEVGSLELGDGILILGVNRGKVTDINLDIDRVLVDIAVKLDEPLREGSEFWVKNTSVMGSTRIILVPGNGDKFLSVDGILPGYKAMGFSGMLSEAEGIMVELKTFFQKLNSSDSIITKYSNIADSLQQSVNAVNLLLQNNENNLNDMITNLNNITNSVAQLLQDNQENISTTITNSGILIDDLSKTNDSVHELSQKTNLLLDKLQNEQSTFGELTSDDELYHSLLRSVSRVDSLLDDMKKNPKKYFTVEIF